MEVEISEEGVVFLDKLVADPVDVLRDVLADNQRMLKALEAISASEDLYHLGMKRHQLVARQALADIDADPERANVGDVIRSKQDSRIEYTVGYVGSEYAFESPQKAIGTWMLPHGGYSIVKHSKADAEDGGE